MTDFGLTRRGTLALLGSSLLAGCTELGVGLGDDSGPELEASEVRDAVAGDLPAVPRTLPVDISAAFLDDGAARARDALDAVPALGPEEVPNEAIRERMARERTTAEDALARAAAAESRYERLDAVTDARERAANLRGAWRAVDGGLTRAAVRERAGPVRDDLTAFTDRREYVGSDPLRAVLVHDELESRVGRADRELSSLSERRPRRYDPDNPLAVGETAAEVERARADVAAATHVYDRFADSLDESRNLADRFERAIETLGDRLRESATDLPREPDDGRPTFVERDIDGTVAESALEDLYLRARDAREYQYRGEDPAGTVVRAHEILANVEAFRTLRERVADGESFPVESAADVKTYRDAAVAAAETTRVDDDYPFLARVVLPRVVSRLSRADDGLSFDEDDGSVRARWIRTEVATYVSQRHVAEAIPDASRATDEALAQ